jgi:C1A family cysteine protease
LDGEIGLVVAVDVTASFRAPNADGYVTYTPNEGVLGGHAMHVAGWVPNADLPALAPTGSGGGYFVLKNSWGEPAGDCGYYYVPYDYLLDYGRSLTTVEVN